MGITDTIKSFWQGTKDFANTDTGKITIAGGIFTILGVTLSSYLNRRKDDE